MKCAVGARQTLFHRGDAGYHTFRIPVLCRTRSGAVLAFAEARRDSARDWGQIDLVLRRSEDGGRSFAPLQVVVTQPDTTNGNPAPVLEAASGDVVLLFCRNAAAHAEKLVFEGLAERSVWVCRSTDDGHSFGAALEITQQVKPADWTWYATGPGQGICLASGRLVFPCDHARREKGDHSDPVRSHVVLSDDGGRSFRLGGLVKHARSSECAVVELSPNRLYLDFRNDEPPHARGGVNSYDGGETFEAPVLLPELSDPGCRAGIALVPDSANKARGCLFISHCFGEKRRELVLQVRRYQQGKFAPELAFTRVALLEAGPAAYSDLLYNEGALLCAFETGDSAPYERIDLVHVASVVSVGAS